jgi:hypothetical protein
MLMTKPLTAGGFDPETTSLLVRAFERISRRIAASSETAKRRPEL